MKIIRGLSHLQRGDARRGAAVVIGNFDGVHRGHQAMLEMLRALPGAAGADTLVTFDPLPMEVLAPERAPARLSSRREKLQQLARDGLSQCVLIPFSRQFAALTPDAFVQQILLDGLGARSVLAGLDFRYGNGRAGTVDTLREAGRAGGFDVHPIDDVTQGGARVSSTRVRAALAAGDCVQAAALLGRAYAISGRVVPGQKLARTLGMRTANIRVLRKPAPRFGVYALRARLDSGQLVNAIGNFGKRPTVAPDGCWLEVHLLDFDGELYGQRMTVEFVKFLRAEQKFDGLDALKAQMHADVQTARAAFAA